MIDGIKTGNIIIPTSIKIDWRANVSIQNGDTKGCEVAERTGLIILRKGKRTWLKGSLHKFKNNGIHNYDDFTHQELIKVINELTNQLAINPESASIENIEFGVNISLPSPADRIIQSLILHKGEPPKRFSVGSGVEFVHSQFIIKVYDKGGQYNLNNNLLRLEIKVVKMQFLHKQGIDIEFLADLYKRQVVIQLQDLLSKTIEEILVVDPLLLLDAEIKDSDKTIILSGANSNYWINLNPTSENFSNGNKDIEYQRKRKEYYKQLDIFQTVLKKYDTGLKNLIVQSMKDKFTELIQDKFTTTQQNKITQQVEDNFTIPIENKITKLNEDKFTNSAKGDGTKLPLAYSVTNSSSKKICPITGLDISMQNEKSRYLTAIGVKFYFENHPDIFQKLEKRLSKYWDGEPLEIRFSEIAHSVRRETYNPRNGYKILCLKKGAKLFDDSPYFAEHLKKSLELSK